jgi:D-alanyl-D-alanine carboxypeptidase (penicillin-binding protein 5/6)
MRGRRSWSLIALGALLALGGAAARAAPVATSSFTWVVPGPAPLFEWPVGGEAAVAVAGVGPIEASPDQGRVPIASLTKMMTALIVLHDHPLASGQAGPTLSIGPEDVAEWEREFKAGDSVVEVRTGEVLTEFQALEALLIPSADNIAGRLASWDAGSTAAFVAKMNAFAKGFQLANTHYADPSGLDPRSASTAADQARVAAELMANPVARSIVRRSRISLPVVGILANANPALAVDGIVGVKGGYTSKAHTCLVTAAFRLHHAALVISVALGQPDPLTAAHVDEALLQAASPSLQERSLLPGAATISGSDPRLVAVPGTQLPVAVVWPGLTVGVRVASLPSAGASALEGPPVPAEVTVSTPWSTLGPYPAGLLPPPGAAGPAARP